MGLEPVWCASATYWDERVAVEGGYMEAEVQCEHELLLQGEARGHWDGEIWGRPVLLCAFPPSSTIPLGAPSAVPEWR